MTVMVGWLDGWMDDVMTNVSILFMLNILNNIAINMHTIRFAIYM